MKRNQNAGAAQWPEPPTVGGSSPQERQFEERLRIAEHIVQVFRESGYSCELADGYAMASTRHWAREVCLQTRVCRI